MKWNRIKKRKEMSMAKQVEEDAEGEKMEVRLKGFISEIKIILHEKKL